VLRLRLKARVCIFLPHSLVRLAIARNHTRVRAHTRVCASIAKFSSDKFQNECGPQAQAQEEKESTRNKVRLRVLQSRARG
jgi:hypothetical protein